MAGKLEEDYWNETSGSSFRFDDENDSNTSLNSQNLLDSKDCILNTSVELYNVLPLSSLLSPKNIDRVLADIEVDHLTNNSLNCLKSLQKTPLEKCFKFDQKIDVLNESISSYDGNLILQIVLFLSKTLKATILYRYLSQKPIALNHFIIYLAAIKSTEVSELIQMSSANRSYFLKLFYISIGPTTTVDYRANKLAKFILEYVDILKGNYEKAIILTFKIFIEFQVDKQLFAPTATTMLIELFNKSKYEMDDSGIRHFIKIMNITVFQSEWLLLNSIASKKLWDKLKESFTASNWITKKKSIKTCIKAELLTYCLHKHRAPNDLLEYFLSVCEYEKRMFLMKKFISS